MADGETTGAREPGALRRAVARWTIGDLAWAAVAVTVGAVAMIALGKLYASFVGGTCTVLCRPHISGSYGAASGLLVYVFRKFE